MVIKTLFKLSAIPVVIFLVLAYSPGFLDISPVHFPFPPPRPFIGPLEPNDKLNTAEKLLRNSIHGPESITFFKGALYTGLKNGWIVRITNDHIIEPIATIGNPNCKPWEEELCGRPAGIRINRNGSLNVADAYYGLYNVDITTGVVKPLFRISQEVNGIKPKMINDFDMIFKTGDIYFSETSHKYSAKDLFYEFLENAPNGRVLHHNLKTNTTTVLVDGLAFPNGVQLSPRRDYLLISETTRKRIMKYHLRGKKEGKLDVFIDNLPGYPDNIRPNGLGGYWVALAKANPPEKPDSAGRLGPTVRKVFARIIHLIQSSLKCMDNFCPSAFAKTLITMVTSLQSYESMDAPYGLILEIDRDGQIIRSLHSPDGFIAGISEVALYGDALYLGSPLNPYLGKLTITI